MHKVKCATCQYRKYLKEQGVSICELARVLTHPLVATITAIYSPCVYAETALHFYKKKEE